MAGFLASFKSEYRTFKHESSTQDVSEYGEPIQKVGLQKDIKGILSKKKYRDGYGLARGELQVKSSEWLLYVPLEYSIKKSDFIRDGDRCYTVDYVNPVYAFGGKLDHNQCTLQLVE